MAKYFKNVFKVALPYKGFKNTVSCMHCNSSRIQQFSTSSLRKIYNRDKGLPTEWILSLTRLQDMDFSKEYILKKIAEKDREKHINAQRELPLSIQAKGYELACAHLIVALGGAVRFHGHTMWHSKSKSGKHTLPNTYVEGLSVEAIDASGTGLRYEGFEHMIDLERLTCLDLSDCPHIDDWCLSRLHHLEHCLAYLNVSKCPNITNRGLESVRHLRNLRRLAVHNLSSACNKELTCLMLEELLPKCLIEGVDYSAALTEAQNSALSVHVQSEEDQDAAFDGFLRRLGYGGDPVKREYFTREYDTGSTDDGLELDEVTWQRLVEEELMAEVERARRQRLLEQQQE